MNHKVCSKCNSKKEIEMYDDESDICRQCVKTENKRSGTYSIPKDHKECNNCLKILHLDSFYKDARRKDGYRDHCIDCFKLRNQIGKSRKQTVMIPSVRTMRLTPNFVHIEDILQKTLQTISYDTDYLYVKASQGTELKPSERKAVITYAETALKAKKQVWDMDRFERETLSKMSEEELFKKLEELQQLEVKHKELPENEE